VSAAHDEAEEAAQLKAAAQAQEASDRRSAVISNWFGYPNPADREQAPPAEASRWAAIKRWMQPGSS
jgi:hypothetical protein